MDSEKSSVTMKNELVQLLKASDPGVLEYINRTFIKCYGKAFQENRDTQFFTLFKERYNGYQRRLRMVVNRFKEYAAALSTIMKNNSGASGFEDDEKIGFREEALRRICFSDLFGFLSIHAGEPSRLLAQLKFWAKEDKRFNRGWQGYNTKNLQRFFTLDMLQDELIDRTIEKSDFESMDTIKKILIVFIEELEKEIEEVYNYLADCEAAFRYGEIFNFF